MNEIEVWNVKVETVSIDGVDVTIENWTSDYKGIKGRMFVGIDPGTKNLGMATLDSSKIHLYQIKTERPKNPVTRMKLLRKIFSYCVNSYKYNTMLVIEGSAFSKRFGEAELAECRATGVWWGLRKGFDVRMIQPNSVRKVVFGNGKKKPQDVWEDLPPDAANALACALWGAKQ